MYLSTVFVIISIWLQLDIYHKYGKKQLCETLRWKCVTCTLHVTYSVRKSHLWKQQQPRWGQEGFPVWQWQWQQHNRLTGLFVMRRQTASSGGNSEMRDCRDPGRKIAGYGRKVQENEWGKEIQDKQKRTFSFKLMWKSSLVCNLTLIYE